MSNTTSGQSPDLEKLIDLARASRLAYLAVFGSVARGDARPDSDVDVYVRFGRPIGLFEMLTLKHAMADALGRPVDLIAEEVVDAYPFVRDGMARDLVTLYEDEAEQHAALAGCND